VLSSTASATAPNSPKLEIQKFQNFKKIAKRENPLTLPNSPKSECYAYLTQFHPTICHKLIQKKCQSYSIFEPKNQKPQNSKNPRKKKCVLTKKKFSVIKEKWRKPKTLGIQHTLGLLYKKPKCPENYILKPFKYHNYIKLRCRKVDYNSETKKFKFHWEDPESLRNGRRLLAKVQNEPFCPIGWELKEFEGQNFGEMKCSKVMNKDEKLGKTFRIWKKAMFRKLSESDLKKFGKGVLFKSVPECEKGWILKDFVKGNWISLKCFKEVYVKKRKCLERKKIRKVRRRKNGVNYKGKKFIENFDKFECIRRNGDSFAKSICMEHDLKASKSKSRKRFIKCKRKMRIFSNTICLKFKTFKGRQECLTWKKILPKAKCKKYGEFEGKKFCKSKVILKPRVYCKKLHFFEESGKKVGQIGEKEMFRSYCLERGVYFGKWKTKRIGCVEWDESGRCVEFGMRKRRRKSVER
jgi:hypothetical protein